MFANPYFRESSAELVLNKRNFEPCSQHAGIFLGQENGRWRYPGGAAGNAQARAVGRILSFFVEEGVPTVCKTASLKDLCVPVCPFVDTPH